METLRDYMTVPLALSLSAKHGPDLLFISDVRVGPDAADENDHDRQARIHKDMQDQMDWYEALSPVGSMLKFRLPWDLESQTVYMEGEIQLPVFGKHLTHESRLIVGRNASLIPYNNTRYERQMAFFNRVLRVALYDEGPYDAGRCYDCVAFRRVIAEYLHHPDPAEVEAMCADVERELSGMSRGLRRARNLVSRV